MTPHQHDLIPHHFTPLHDLQHLDLRPLGALLCVDLPISGPVVGGRSWSRTHVRRRAVRSSASHLTAWRWPITATGVARSQRPAADRSHHPDLRDDAAGPAR